MHSIFLVNFMLRSLFQLSLKHSVRGRIFLNFGMETILQEIFGNLFIIYLTNSLEPLKILCFLRIFVLMPGVKSPAVSAQIGLHQPDKREEVIDWFRNVFSHLSEASLKDEIIDSDFIGLAICDALELRSPELLPEIKRSI